MIINSHLNEFKGNINAQWQKVQIITDLCDVTLSCEDKQIKIHILIISSFSPITLCHRSVKQTYGTE